MATSKPVLAYWNLRGRAEPIRLILAYTETDYENKVFTMGGPPVYIQEWLDVKDSVDMDFPNLPYYIDGDVKVGESWAIVKYIAQCHNLLPEGVNANNKCNQAEGITIDFLKAVGEMIYYPDKDNNKEKFYKKLPDQMARFDKYLGKNKWMGGVKLTYVDFYLCEVLDRLLMADSDVYSKYPNVDKYLNNFMGLKQIAAYRSSPKFKASP